MVSFLSVSLGLRGASGADNRTHLTELRFEGCTSNEESINILLSNKSSHILGVGRTSILDSSSGGDLSRDVISQPLPDIGVGILGNLWSGSLSSSNGPHWLIGENDLSPVGDAVLDSVKLSFEDIVGLLSFTFSQSLSNTEDCVKARLLRSENLLGNNGISLAEESSSLRVSNNCPLELKVLDLIGTDFTGESSILFCRDVLGRDLNVRIKHGFG